MMDVVNGEGERWGWNEKNGEISHDLYLRNMRGDLNITSSLKPVNGGDFIPSGG